MPAVVIDLDGTLCNCDHRVHHVQNKHYGKFNSLLLGDESNHDVVWMLCQLPQCVTVIFLTARSDKWLKPTEDWLYKHYFRSEDCFLLMRSEGDNRPDSIVKPELLLEHYNGDKEQLLANVKFILEDRDKVVKAWREYGVPCWQVRAGNY